MHCPNYYSLYHQISCLLFSGKSFFLICFVRTVNAAWMDVHWQRFSSQQSVTFLHRTHRKVVQVDGGPTKHITLTPVAKDHVLQSACGPL